MTDELDRQVRQALQRQKRFPGFLVSIGGLAVVAAGCAYLLLNYGGPSTGRSAAAPAVAGGEGIVTEKDFQLFQRQTADSLQSAAQEIAAEKAELKNLSDQVTALAAKIDGLQSAASSGPLQPAVPARPPAAVARKKPPGAPKTGAISVGGAPLPPAPAEGTSTPIR